MQGQLKILLDTITSRIIELEKSRGGNPTEEKNREILLKFNKTLYDDILLRERTKVYHQTFAIDTPGIPNLTQ
jgi:hypothetical protein